MVKIRMATNDGSRRFAIFMQHCELAKVEPTVRQFNAWQRGAGAAHEAAKREAGHNRRIRAGMIEVGVWL